MKRIIASLAFLMLLAFCRGSFAETVRAQENKLIVFYSPGCRECMEVKNKLLPVISREYAGSVAIEELDISDIENYKLLLGLRDRFRADMPIVVPVLYYGGDMINGKQASLANVRRLIERSLSAPKALPAAQKADLAQRFKAFRPLAVGMAGMLDGVNPCAFTVIVFFMSYLTLQGYRKRELALAGLSFIFAVFVTYLLLGLGIFNFLYYLEGFWAAAKAINISIGILAIGLGIAALYDFVKYKRTRSTEGLALQLPRSLKNRIHRVIGKYHRKSGAAEDAGHFVPDFVAAALISGFIVSLLEAVCTGQTYLPTISFILKTSPLKLQAFGYLVFYNLMFVTPLLVIFLLALLGATSDDFTRFLKRHLLTVKLLMAVLFFGLGIYLIWRYI